MDTASSFGSFCLVPGQRRLLDDGRPVRLGSRAFDILVALVERAGEVVPNAELMARVWSNTVVEPGALRVHMAGLRKVLGDGRGDQRYIVNVPMQGYCFVAPVVRSSPSAETAQEAQDTPAPLPLPAQLIRMIGREGDLAEVLRELPRHRCVTLVGPGGMGKTTLALAAAREVLAQFDGQVAFVALASQTDPSLITASLISAFGLKQHSADPLQGLLSYLRERRLLIVLDNCEHLIDATAQLAETLLSAAPQVHLLVTSREPLRIQGEWIQRLASLAVPAPLARLTAHEALAVPSVELFVERTRAMVDSFSLTDDDVADITAICRALDGIPLALELAAAGVERMGVKGVVSHLGQRLSLLTRGRRTALPRHQTLRAALDWGYALLTEPEQALLRRLSIFKGRFTLEAVRAVCGGTGAGDIDDNLFNLSGKSLVASDVSGEHVQFWLLETTREYAAELRDAHGESDALARLHARYMLTILAASNRDREARPSREWLSDQAPLVDDYRAAIQWSMASPGDVQLGVSLAAAAASLWFALSLTTEYLDIAKRALSIIEGMQAPDLQAEMALYEAIGSALWHFGGGDDQPRDMFRRLLVVSERIGSKAHMRKALFGLWTYSGSYGEWADGLRLALRFGELLTADDKPETVMLHHRMMSLSLHLTGRHAEAVPHSQIVIDQPVVQEATARDRGYRIDQRVSGLMSMARILWMLGRFGRALGMSKQAIERALAIDHSLSLCFCLALTCVPLAFWSGDWSRASELNGLLLERAQRHSLGFWHAYGTGYDLVLRRRSGSTDGLDSLDYPKSWKHITDMLCTIDASLADDETLTRGLRDTARWCAPELMRIQAERAREAGNEAACQGRLDAAIALAKQQQALAWELRAVMSLAHLLDAGGTRRDAYETLAPVVQALAGEFETADLGRARALLEALSIR